MNKTRIYTDGGCSGNPGPGGWAYVILYGSQTIQGSGGEENTTNNQMELTAVIKALEKFASSRTLQSENPVIYTDSTYVKNGITQWIKKWIADGWKTASKKPVKNKILWEHLHQLNVEIQAEWKWVKGHSGNTYNEICDSLVGEQIAIFKESGNLTGSGKAKNAGNQKGNQNPDFSLNGKRFRIIENSSDNPLPAQTIFDYHQKGNSVWAEYSGGSVGQGHLIGIIDNKNHLDFCYHHIANSTLISGMGKSHFEIMKNGRLGCHEERTPTRQSADGSVHGNQTFGKFVIEEID